MSARGFSLIELSLVLVVVGVLMAAGITAWNSVIETRKIAKSASVLYQIRDCLVRRVAFSERYPTYTPGLLPDCSNADMTLDVDACLCEQDAVDAWSARVYFIEGINATAGGPIRNLPMITDEPRGITRAKLHLDSNATDHKGVHRNDIAFILVGANQNGLSNGAGGVGYPVFNGLIGSLAGAGVDPDFRKQDDDVYVIVTSQELVSKIR